MSELRVEEPEKAVTEFDIAVSRLAGTMDIVAVQWTATTYTGTHSLLLNFYLLGRKCNKSVK